MANTETKTINIDVTSGENSGDLIYFNGTEWTILNVGADGYFLSSNGGTDLIWKKFSDAATGDVSGIYPNLQVNDLTISGEQQGSILYFDGANWIQLPPGNSNYVLTTKGSSANPVWQEPQVFTTASTGDVSGTYPNLQVNDLTISGEQQGSILYFDGIKWSQLPPSFDGYVLSSTGTGSDPIWKESQDINGAPAGGDLSGTYPNPQIATGVIVNADINASADIAVSKLLAGNDGYVLTVSGSAVIWDQVGGDLSGLYPNLQVNDLTISGEQQGSILYFDGYNWAQLAPGTDGYLLSTKGVGANPIWTVPQDINGSPAGGDLSGTYPNPQIAAGVIVNADINASADIAVSKLLAGNDGYILSSLSGNVAWTSPSTTGTDGYAIHDNVAAEISNITLKATPTSSDELIIEDAADTYNKKSVTIGTLPVSGDVSGTLGNITLNNTVVDTAELVDDSVTFDKIQNITTDRLLGRDTAASGSVEEISLGTGLQFSGTQSISTDIDGASLEFNVNTMRRAALTGDVTATAGSNALSIASNVITNTHINASAAIAYSKLSLTNSILNADINASAAIAYSKLSLTGGIVNADINAAADIAVSKLADNGIDGYVLTTSSGSTVWSADIHLPGGSVDFETDGPEPSTISSGSVTVSFSGKHNKYISVGENITSFSINGAPSASKSLYVYFNSSGAYTIAFNANADGAGGVWNFPSGAPSLTSTGKDLLAIKAIKIGGTWTYIAVMTNDLQTS